MGCTFEPLYSEKILSEYHIIEPNKSNKDLHQVYSSLKRLIFLNNKDLTGSPHKTSNKENLFDFIKNRVKISLCVSEKFVL